MNGIFKRCLAAVSIAVVGGFASGCGNGSTVVDGGREAGVPRLVFVTNSNADWWNAVEKGMEDGASEFGAEVELRRNQGQPQGQVEKLRAVLSQPDVDGVAVSAIEADSPGVIDAMRELQEAGIVVICIDSDVASDYSDVRRAYIGTNNEKAGEVAGHAARLVRPQGGQTAVFVGTASAANARERERGFFQGAGSDFEKSQTWEDGGDHQKARGNVQSALSKSTDLGMLVGLWSYNAPAIAAEVGRSATVRAQVGVVTFDLDEAARSQIADGNIDATVCQNPYEMGRLGVQLLKALIEQDEATVAEILPDGQSRDTGVRVVVPSADSPAMGLRDDGEEVLTIDEMNTWLESKGLKST